MINYIVRPGDTLSVLAVKFKTTIQVLLKDNPFIPKNQKLTPGWKIEVLTPSENAKRYADTIYTQVEDAHRLIDEVKDYSYLFNPSGEKKEYKDRIVYDGQLGYIRIQSPTPLWTIQANGFLKMVRMVEPGEIHPVFDVSSLQGGLYLVNHSNWITTNSEVSAYERIPEELIEGRVRYLRDLKSVMPVMGLISPQMFSMGMMASAASSTKQVKAESYFGSGPRDEGKRFAVPPKTFLGSGSVKGSSNKGAHSPLMPHFQRPGYRRPILIMQNAKGETSKVEMRMTGFSTQHNINIQPNATNGGWMINVRANGLPVLNFNGFLLETKTNLEFKDFMYRYHRYAKAQKVDDYYSIGISKLYYKNTEYQGIIASFSTSDREDESLHRKYSMQMIVLKEKLLSTSDMNKVKSVVDRKGKSELAFRSDLGGMLANPMTGKYNTDFY